jgi:hypothetical protein
MRVEGGFWPLMMVTLEPSVQLVVVPKRGRRGRNRCLKGRFGREGLPPGNNRLLKW